ncbi:MAG: hypothetical protein V5786_11315 [Psychromonas sp.]
MKSYPVIEIPFNFRHHCWFCGEPDHKNINFPKKAYETNIVDHPAICVPSCKECAMIIQRSAFTSIYAYRDAIKQALVKKHQKILSIGSNWTKQELQESELEGSAFAGFKRSAWPMFEMMQARINYKGWAVIINNDQLIEEQDNEAFEFDGINHVCLEDAVAHVIKTFFLDEQLFTRVLSVLGKGKFSQAIRLCRLYPNLSSKQRESVFLEILDSIGL